MSPYMARQSSGGKHTPKLIITDGQTTLRSFSHESYHVITTSVSLPERRLGLGEASLHPEAAGVQDGASTLWRSSAPSTWTGCTSFPQYATCKRVMFSSIKDWPQVPPPNSINSYEFYWWQFASVQGFPDISFIRPREGTVPGDNLRYTNKMMPLLAIHSY